MKRSSGKPEARAASGSAGRILDRSDAALLRVFCTVVECDGYSPAQAKLNVSASNISMKMTALERRLGLRLCQRGRVGFQLTEEGEIVYQAARRLFLAHSSFLEEVEFSKGTLSGSLCISVIDATTTHPQFKLSEAIGGFIMRHSSVYFSLTSDEPSQIERKLLSGEVHIGIAPFYHHIPNLTYAPILEEPHSLYCGRGHSLFERPPAEITRHEVECQPRAMRSYVPSSASLSGKEHPAAATVADMESMLHVILSGAFIGYMPCHFAMFWVDSGMLRPIRPDLFHHTSVIEVAIRKGAGDKRLMRMFYDQLLGLHQK